jgi:uncharacterized membrane protein
MIYMTGNERLSIIARIAEPMVAENLTTGPSTTGKGGMTKRERLQHLDGLRGWAIFLMVLIHSLRGFLARTYAVPGEVEPDSIVTDITVAVRAFLFTTEPYISALFLTVSGYALVVVWRRLPPARRRSWQVSRLRRAGLLILISWVIFWSHAGINSPYPFVNAGVLYNIGIGIAVSVWMLPAKRSHIVVLLALTALLCCATLFAEANPDHLVAVVAQGPGAHLPNLLFFPLGMALAWVWCHGGRVGRFAVPLGGLVIVIIYHTVVIPPVQGNLQSSGIDATAVQAVFNAPFGRIVSRRRFVAERSHGSIYDLKWLAHKAGLQDDPPKRNTRRRSFWNKRFNLMPYLAGLMALTFGLAWLPFGGNRKWFMGLARPLLLLGRHALFLYVFHLVVIAIGVGIFGTGHFGPAGTLVSFLLVLIACALVARLLEWWQEKRVA